MRWSKRPFIDFLNAVDDRLERIYGITSRDTNMDLIAAAHEAGETPGACAAQIGEKYCLTPKGIIT